MDSPEASSSMKEDTSSSSPSPESPFLTYSKSLSPLRHPVKINYQTSFSSCCLLDGLDSANLIYTPPRSGSPSPRATLFQSDFVGGESHLEDPFDPKKVSEEPLPSSEEPKTVHQEKPAYVDDAEWSFQECREHHQDCAAQLMPEPLQDVKECEGYGETGPALHISAENMFRDGSEASQQHSFGRHCLQFEEAASNSLGSDEIGGEILIVDPYYFNKWSEGPLLLSEEPETVDQGKPAYVDEPGKIQDVEWPSQECRVVESNLYADFVLKSHRHGSLFQGAVRDWEDSEDDTPQLTPEPLQDVMECEDCGEVGPALHISAENMTRDVSESMQASQNHNVVRRCLHFEEAASNSLGTVGSINFPLAAPSPEESISSAFSPVSKDLTASLMATSSSKMKMNKPSEDSEPMTSLHLASVHDTNKLQPASAGNSKESFQPMPEKKVMTTPIITDDRIRCACKISKCMKRLCRCFAAELYCSELCACLGCLNRPENLDEIDDAKQTIKSHNPFAFAPKIVQNATDIPLNNTEDVNLKTPSSARQNRACSCKLSKCLIRSLCDCYQVKAGCSSWCRSRGFENSYGKKEDLHDNVNDVHDLSPLPPSLQCSDMSQLPLTNASQPTPLANPASMFPASMFGASWDWTHIPPHGSSYPLFVDPLPPYISPIPVTPVTGLGETTNLPYLEFSNPVSFASNIVQSATDIPSNNTVDANMKTPSSSKWHKQGCACVKSKCLNKFSCDCYLFNAGCTSKCRCVRCENSYGKKGDHVAMERRG